MKIVTKSTVKTVVLTLGAVAIASRVPAVRRFMYNQYK